MPTAAGSNLPELTVGELSRALKRTIEGAYERVRLRGEVSGFTRARSGHLYMALKDQDALIDAVCWRSTAPRLAVMPEDGLEVIATGRITTYAPRSRYQIVIESIEVAGEGALLKMVEDRRRRLEAEGLFAAERKRDIPFLPEVVGVVTSPTGAVFRDILHRLRDRFPREVVLWGVPVQGDAAPAAVAGAVRGFDALAPDGPVPRPDVLIVGRGGGSVEDLMAFNEEEVVRAVAGCSIPVISAVGHETDTTLVDHAADVRAPTPTAAAEKAVPVRADLEAQVLGLAEALVSGVHRAVTSRRDRVGAAARGLVHPARTVQALGQRIDDLWERVSATARARLERTSAAVARTAARLRTPQDVIESRRGRAARAGESVERGFRALMTGFAHRLEGVPSRLLRDRMGDRLAAAGARLGRFGDLLEAHGPENVLARGYVLVRTPEGELVRQAKELADGDLVDLVFSVDRRRAEEERRRRARIGGDGGPAPGGGTGTSAAPAKAPPDIQGRLL